MFATAAMPTATAITVYHVNPLHEGVLPFDMDTADLAGDAFFDLRSKVLPIECAFNVSMAGDCTNQEVVDPDLVITKLSLTVKKRYGEYSRCNICGADGKDPFSHFPCKPNAYICTCGSCAPSAGRPTPRRLDPT